MGRASVWRGMAAGSTAAATPLALPTVRDPSKFDSQSSPGSVLGRGSTSPMSPLSPTEKMPKRRFGSAVSGGSASPTGQTPVSFRRGTISFDLDARESCSLGHFAEGDEGVAALVALLQQQRHELLQAHAKEDAHRAAVARKEAKARAGKAGAVAKPWRGPNANPEEFSSPGMLPNANACGSSPTRAERAPLDGTPPQPPFLQAYAVPRLFGSETPLIWAGVRSLTSEGGAPGAAGKSPRISPQHAKLKGVEGSFVAPRWGVAGFSPRLLEATRYLSEHTELPASARVATPAAAAGAPMGEATAR
eukprot:CAMPEP_0183406640 /NCGR_PEP_ID=MMETSP0370-20130417/16749_1 /TAXON_ID=268820 /ORGANISM="Peridinium aciculiferum, Strain PAER-2" /LENGTH=304 /DNA_ID=CAMNT_0025588847 /DNA_START=28 /DNA_END=942 /DNA_ORIENTATION=-